MHPIEHRDESELYRLSAEHITDQENPCLTITLSSQAVAILSAVSKEHPMVKRFFVQHPTQYIDFKNSLKEGSRFGFKIFQEGLFTKRCRVRRGSGDTKIIDVPVPEITGWHELFAVAASLHVLFTALYYSRDYDVTENDKPYQLFHLSTVVEQKMHGAEMGGSFSIFLTKWLQSHHRQVNIEKIEKLMCHASHLLQSRKLDEYDRQELRVEIRPEGEFLASCQGDRTCLHPSSYSTVRNSNHEEGYRFSSHNVDTPAQQFVLLTALAALSDQVPRESG